MRCKTLYHGYYIGAIGLSTEDGRFRAQAAVVALDGEQTRSQRFLDFESFDSASAADERAVSGSKEWVDKEILRRRARLPTDFASFA